MYQVMFKKTKKFIMGGEVFFTYERARQAARKHARSMIKMKKLKKTAKFGLWDYISRNPTCLTGHYNIVRHAD